MSSAASRRSNGRLTVKASSSSDGPVLEAAVPQGVHARRVHATVFTRRSDPPLAGRPGLDAEPPQADEAGRVLVAEAVARVVGGELVVVEAVRAAATGHDAAAGLEVQAHLTGDELLARVDERVEGLLQRREPEAVVDELRVARLDPGLLPVEVALEADRLEILVGEDQRQARRALVGLPALDADPAVLDHVDAPPPVGTDDVVQGIDDLQHAEPLRRRSRPARPARSRSPRRAARWPAASSSTTRPGGGTAHGSSISPHSMARPQRLSSIEYTFSFVAEIGMSVAVGVEDRLLAGHAPAPHGRDHLEVGGEGPGRHLEAHLVVALAGAAVGDRVGAVGPRRGHEVLHDHRPRQRRHQRVAALVERVRLRARERRTPRRTRRGRRRRPRRRAPAASARSRSTSQSSDACPTSTASAMTSTPISSIIQRTATLVSRPPL